MNKDQVRALLALNEEQKALLEEWNDLKGRMEKANMMIIIGDGDSGHGNFAVINKEYIADYITPMYEYKEEELKDFEEIEVCGILGENKDIPFGNFALPNAESVDCMDDYFYVRFKDITEDSVPDNNGV